MESQAFFTGIREKIIEHLQAATDSVLVAVAWLTQDVSAISRHGGQSVRDCEFTFF